MPPNQPPEIFAEATRRAKRARSDLSDGADFIHIAAAEDVVDRLETVLRPFSAALFHGPGAAHIIERLTDAAQVQSHQVVDDLPGEGVDIVAAANHLPIADGSCDLVVSSMGLHAMNDLTAALAEMRRVLKPDGLFIGVFPGERTLHELRWALQTAETEILGKVAPRVFPQIAVKDAGALLQHAGFALPVADVIHLPVTYGQPMRLIADLRAMGETNALQAAPRGALRRDVFARAMAFYGERFADEEGRLKATFDLVTVTGWAPDASQPKPLKPGSAKTSLADVFKTGI